MGGRPTLINMLGVQPVVPRHGGRVQLQQTAAQEAGRQAHSPQVHHVVACIPAPDRTVGRSCRVHRRRGGQAYADGQLVLVHVRQVRAGLQRQMGAAHRKAPHPAGHGWLRGRLGGHRRRPGPSRRAADTCWSTTSTAARTTVQRPSA